MDERNLAGDDISPEGGGLGLIGLDGDWIGVDERNLAGDDIAPEGGGLGLIGLD